MYNIFTDFHHASLLNSLIMLFEGRLGGNVYRPIGTQWYEKGFWKIYDHPATVQQYLGIGSATPDGSPTLNNVAWKQSVYSSNKPIKPVDGLYHCRDIVNDKTNKAITFDAFMSLDINIVIASIPEHIEPFRKLCNVHYNKPKLIYQIGNAWNINPALVQNVMASAIIPNIPPNINFVSYHQEFDLSTFYPQLDHIPYDPKKVYSFVNCFDTQDQFALDWQLFQDVEQLMQGWDFKVYGGSCRDGAVGPASEVANKMRDSRFIWHTKNNGDGFGHVIHNAPAVGRPLIVKKSYYMGKMAEPLLIDGQTCLCIDGLSAAEIAHKIDYFNDPARYISLCQTAYANFTKIVNFDKEEIAIRSFLEKLK